MSLDVLGGYNFQKQKRLLPGLNQEQVRKLKSTASIAGLHSPYQTAPSLTRSLRKKLGYATIESVQKLEESSAEKIPEEKEDNPTPILWSSSYGQYPQVPLYYAVVSDPYPSNCVTM
ncbi:hypothetical protein CFP56_018204 [Quercus suber]|uniref:Uncharacterized protein n=1 Tax=Quercus suber TaxID=58331 RepID=A0AAW0KK58_QUESU